MDQIVPEATDSALALVANAPIVLPAVDARGMKEAMSAYTDMCAAILVPSDYQTIRVKGQERTFKKRSAWQKLATAFSVTITHVDRNVETNENGQVVRAEFVVRATAPNGRAADGYGACSARERGFDKPDHDIPATAETRASNRACANLFAFGELSAEEMPDDRTAGSDRAARTAPTAASKPVTSSVPRPLARNPVKLVRTPQGMQDSDGEFPLNATAVAENPASPVASEVEKATLRLGILQGYCGLLRGMPKYAGWEEDDLEVRTTEVVDQWCQMQFSKALHELSLEQLQRATVKLKEAVRKRAGAA